jgi:sugar O-acyltransferase (sialic acid O-acetyltransferase NeuD family)
MAKIIVIGGGGHAKVVISVLNKLKKFELLGYTDRVNNGRILGAKYLGNDSVLPAIKKKHPTCEAVIGVGNVKISDLREKIDHQLEKLKFKLPALVSPTAIVNRDVDVGEGTVIMDGVVIQPGTKIGACAIINTGALIDHDCSVGDYVHVAPGAVLCGGVQVGRGSLVGAGSTVIQYKKVGKDCLIGAGSTVIRDCLKPGTYFGLPAKLVK